MEVLNQELQLQTGEDDVARGLTALNIAQDGLDALIAKEAGTRMKTLPAAFTMTANQEFTAIPTGYLRTDRLQLMDTTGTTVQWDLRNLRKVGSHNIGRAWLTQLLIPGPATGSVYWYEDTGTQYWWRPTPDVAYKVRWWGYQAATDLAVGTTFEFPDYCAMPLAAMAVEILLTGIGDDPTDVGKLGEKHLKTALEQMRNFNKDGGTPLEYRYSHDT